jgi:hypothetical protein
LFLKDIQDDFDCRNTMSIQIFFSVRLSPIGN